MKSFCRFCIYVAVRGILVLCWATITLHKFLVPALLRPSSPPLTATASRHLAPPSQPVFLLPLHTASLAETEVKGCIYNLRVRVHRVSQK
uniref:Uncharacterized protein n=1 Tax=Octopus bimaculoides TaxID=37653 RepID=A0A0L8GQ53_OCTBM